MTIKPGPVPKVPLIIGAGLAVIIAACGLVWWWVETTADQRAEETARSMCVAKIREAGGDPGGLRLAGSARVDGATMKFWFDGATVGARAVVCTTEGYRSGGWISAVSLSYP